MTMPDFKLLFTAVIFYALIALTPGSAKVMAAAAPDSAGTGLDGLMYYTLGPSFVTNYDGAGRLKYLKTDIAVRIEPGTAPLLLTHLPYIRNRLVVLLAAQLEENLTSTQGKEALRAQALAEVKAAMDLVVGTSAGNRIYDLYFTSFVVQR